MIVCLDTSVWVSAFATRGLCADIVNAVLLEHRLVVGATILAELQAVLRGKLHVPAALASELDALIRLHATVITDAVRLNLPGVDQNDGRVVSEAVAGNAEVLVTGDRDLLTLGGRAPIALVSPRGFWERLRSR